MIDNKIIEIKRKVLEFMEQEAGKYGNTRMDTKQMGELADIVKDLAEAEYYCSVSEAMNGQQEAYGYTPMGRMGYPGGQGGSGSGGGSMGGSMGGGGRSGYGGMMGHSDPMSTIRDILATADPETKARIRNELMM